jgi:uncharacterized protein
MMNRITHFEIQAEDPERAIAFYKDVFGWDIQKWGEMEYWMIMTAPKDSTEPGINGGILKRPAKTPGHEFGTNAYVCTVQVEHYDEIEKKILAAGGIVAMPKFAFPGMAWQGYYVDTEGNTFGLHQTDPSAA